MAGGNDLDIRRIPLWESRNATYMSNNLVRAIVEDQGEVAIELSARSIQGGYVNALSLPYFRGRGIGVLSDQNADWWKSKQSFYQAGGIYMTFPGKNEDDILFSNTYWMVRRYGSDGESGGLWRLSEMKSRQEHNRYWAGKVDLLLPGHPVLYTLARVTNTGEEDLVYNAEVHSMLCPPFIESGCFVNTVPAFFTSFAPNFREVAFNRLRSSARFSDLRHAPSVSGSSIDASYIPGPTGSYDYLVGEIAAGEDLGWISVINPRLQMIYLSFFPTMYSRIDDSVMKSPTIDLAFNLLGRMDSPWALYEGGTSQVFSLTTGFGRIDHHDTFSTPGRFVLKPGESMDIVSGQAFTSYDNPRMSNGFYTMEKEEGALVFKRTKSYLVVPCDYGFTTVRTLSQRLFQNSQS